MSKKKKHKKSGSEKTSKFLLATAIINFLIAILNLLHNLFD